jgi:hypothetical protein
MFLTLTRPFDYRDILDVRHSAGDFLEKVQRVTQKVSFNGQLQGKLRVRKIEARVVLDVPDDSDKNVKINHANYLKFYHTNKFVSLLKFYQSKQRIS